MHRLKILQYCKVKGEREVKTIYLSMKVKVKQLVAQSCPILCDPMDCSLPGSSVHGILQVRILEWVAMPPQGDLPNPGIEPRSPALQVDFLQSEQPEKPKDLIGQFFFFFNWFIDFKKWGLWKRLCE